MIAVRRKRTITMESLSSIPIPKTDDTCVSLYDHFLDADTQAELNFTILDCPGAELYTKNPEEFFDCNAFLNSSCQTNISSVPSTTTLRSQIRNHDCMWSGRCTTHPGSYAFKSKKPCNAQTSTSTTHQQQSLTTTTQTPEIINGVTIKVEPDTENTIITRTPLLTTAPTQKKSIQQVPAGRSLLLNSRLNQKPLVDSKSAPVINNRMATLNRIPTLSTSDFLRDREDVMAPRPDTPLSLDDDPIEFKHTIDLNACTVGSNRMSLIGKEDQIMINLLKEHLQGTTNDTTSSADICAFMAANCPTDIDSLNDVYNDMKELSDFEGVGEDEEREEEDDDDEEEDEDDDEDEDEEEEEEEDSAIEIDSDCYDRATIQKQPTSMKPMLIIPCPTVSNVSNNNNASSYEFTHSQIMHSDHSYTRCKNIDLIGLGVQTPSDSEEEIDVVSVGDKTLPTNPSAKDRRALQTTVAHKISAARMVRAPKVIKTLQPRRRNSNDSPLFPTSQQQLHNHHQLPITPQKSSYNSSSSCSSQSFGSPNYVSDTSTTSNSRKRPLSRTPDNGINRSSYGNNSAKRLKTSKKQQRMSGGGSANTSNSSSSNNTTIKRSSSDTDEADTIEKRNLHNDMERQRRIGLKNLFDELKRQIPSIKDKERAPKVHILREAALLCSKLSRDDKEIEALKKQQAKLCARVKLLRKNAAAQRH